MKESRHTAGPWEVSRDATPEYAPQYTVYCDAASDDWHLHRVATAFVSEANAALIAAAPDMYEALVMVEREIGPEDRSTSRKVRAALARAGWSR